METYGALTALGCTFGIKKSYFSSLWNTLHTLPDVKNIIKINVNAVIFKVGQINQSRKASVEF